MRSEYFFVKEKHNRPSGEDIVYQVYKMKHPPFSEDMRQFTTGYPQGLKKDSEYERKLEISKYGCETEQQAIVEIKKWMKQDGVL